MYACMQDAEQPVDDTYLQAPATEFILAVFMQRCTDKSSTVRAKAMACLSKAVGRLVAAHVADAARPRWLQAHTAILTGDRFLEFDLSKLPRRAGGASGGGGAESDGEDGHPGRSPPPGDRCFAMPPVLCELHADLALGSQCSVQFLWHPVLMLADSCGSHTTRNGTVLRSDVLLT